MNSFQKFLFGFLGFISLLAVDLTSGLRAEATEKVITPVAIAGQPAPGTTNGVKFAFTESGSFDLSNDGDIAFIADLTGTGVNQTNRSGVWTGQLGNLALGVRGGQLTTDAGALSAFSAIVMNESGDTALYGNPFAHESKNDFEVLMHLAESGLNPNFIFSPPLLSKAQRAVQSLAGVTAKCFRPLTHNSSYFGTAVELSGPGVDPLNDLGIASGTVSNFGLVARNGSPAPGTSGVYTGLELLGLLPDGRVFFSAGTSIEGDVLYLGSAGAVQPVAVSGQTAPNSLLGPGYTYDYVAYGVASANAKGEVAYEAHLSGPGINVTNAMTLVTGPPASPRVVARAGTVAPGTSEFFENDFRAVAIGSDGRVAFLANLFGTNFEYGLWLAPPAQSPVLIARTGQPAPGTPAGVVFRDVSETAGPYLNRQGQFVFFTTLTGTGIGPTNNTGIWLVQPEGSVELVVRAGDTIDIGGGTNRQLTAVSFGVTEDYAISSGEDGRQSPFNDRSEIGFIASWNETPLKSASGIFLARSGIVLGGQKVGADIVINFPTLAGKHYRVEYATSQPATSWSTLAALVAGTGASVTVTDAGAAALPRRFYRAVRVD